MAEDTKKHIDIEDGNAEAEAAAAAAEGAKEEAAEEKAEDQKAEEAKEEAAEETAKEPEAKDEEAEKKAAEEAESERYMRLMAEFQNYKRRAAKEKTDTLQYANEKIVGDLLPVLDNFERALDTETEDEGYAKGMQLIFEQLKTALGNAGLEEIKAMDEEFDPNFHNAVMTDNIEDKEDGVITKVLQKGYKLRDKVVRPSMVAVNKK